MVSGDLVDKIRMLLNENNVSVETCISITKLLTLEKFKNLDEMNNEYIKALHDIKMILQNDESDDFECVEKIVAVFENLDIDIEYT